MSQKILVTGGAGFIGANYVEFHFNNYPEDEIVVLDKLTYAGKLENLKEFQANKDFSFIKGDICDKETVKRAFEGVDVVVHFAAETHVDRSIKGQAEFLETNISGTYTLLEAATNSNLKRFIQIGTDEVYGSVEKGSSKETDELKPRNPYSASKAAADRLAYSYYCTYGLPVIMTRASNNFGPKQFPEKVIPLFITNLLQGKKVPLYGDGKNVRDWLYVMDHASAIDTIIEKGKLGEVYNVGGSKELENIELTKMILSELGFDESMIEPVKDRPGHDRRYSLDSSKLIGLGWQPQFEFSTALKQTIKWYQDNAWWWKPLTKR